MRLYSTFNKYLISIFTGCLILFLSTTDAENLARLPRFYGADKLLHLLMYMGLSFSLSMENSIAKYKKRLALVLLFPILYGGIIEIVQEYCLVLRSGDWIDWVADIVGAATGCLLAARLYSVRIIRKIFRR